MSVRQYELQSITKNLENKIILLKQENKIMSERYEYRMKEMSEQHTRVIADKDKTIQYLKHELEKDKQLQLYEQTVYDSHKLAEQNDLLKELQRYIKKCNDLERKLQTVTEKYELKRKEMDEENMRLREQCEDFSTSRSNIQQEIDKINKFYMNSKVQQPRRNQTLELVDKLTDFIFRFEQDRHRYSKDSVNLLKVSLEGLKQDLLGPMKTLTDQDELLFKERKNILSQIADIIEFQNKITKESSEQNEKMWQMLKKERSNQQIQKIAELEKQLTSRSQKYQNQTTHLQSRIKQLQNERKTLLLGFTELKTLNETRQKSYRDEIAVLKKSLDEIMTAIEDREGQFENQIQTLHGQLTHLNERYYENIEVPLNKLTGKLQIQIKNARKQIQKLTSNKDFGKLVHNLQLTLQKYVKQQQIPDKLIEQMAFYSERTQELTLLCKEALNDQSQEKLMGSDGNLQIDALINEFKLREIQWIEKENKLCYEMNTLKKHNKKLKELYDQQSQQNKDRSCSNIKRNSARIGASQANVSKLVQLQIQNESLKQANYSYQQKFMIQLEEIRKAVSKITNSSQKDNNSKKISEGLYSIKIFNDRVANFIEEQNMHIKAVKDTINTIDKILVKPIEIFDQFVERVANCYPSFTPYSTQNQNNNTNSFVPLQKLQSFYEEITLKRQNNTISTNRLTSELIRTLRESMQSQAKTKAQQQIEKNEQKVDKNKYSRDTQLEKKVRQLQNQKIKNREQVLRKLQKLEEVLKAVEAKVGRRSWTPPFKLEDLLEKKIVEITETYMSRTMDNSEELAQITTSTLKQLRLKLKNCMLENEGLIKELDCMQKLKSSV